MRTVNPDAVTVLSPRPLLPPLARLPAPAWPVIAAAAVSSAVTCALCVALAGVLWVATRDGAAAEAPALPALVDAR